MKVLKTYSAKIFIGTKIGYDNYPEYSQEELIYKTVQDYCNANPVGVNISKTKFIYVDGEEDGFCIEFIQYPRFPDTEENIKGKALFLANHLLEVMKQQRCTVVCTDETYLVEAE